MNHYFVHVTPIDVLVLEVNFEYLIKIIFNRNPLPNRFTAYPPKKNLILEKIIEQLDEYFFIIENFYDKLPFKFYTVF